MTINQIATKIIKEIRAFPTEARQSQGESDPKTSWDEYKEQIQFEEYDSFDVFQETIESMVEDDINGLSEEEIDSIYATLHKNHHPKDLEEKRKYIVGFVIEYLKEKAESEEIKYKRPSIRYIRFQEEEIYIIAKVLKQVGPEDYLVHAYSEITGGLGEQGIVDLNDLEYYNAMERISKVEFEKELIILRGSN